MALRHPTMMGPTAVATASTSSSGSLLLDVGIRRRRASGGFSRRLPVVVKASSEEDARLQTSQNNRLLAYARAVEPAAALDDFVRRQSPVAVDAVRQSVAGMMGSISASPQFFSVTITTVGENLAALMSSVMLTGYMFAAADERRRLAAAVFDGGSPAFDASEPLSSTSSSGIDSDGSFSNASSSNSSSSTSTSSSTSGRPAAPFLDGAAYAPGSQKTKVSGDVLLWHKDNGVEALPAAKYIAALEAEVERLRAAAAAAAAPPPQPPRLPPAAAWGLDGSANNNASSSSSSSRDEAAAAALPPALLAGGGSSPLAAAWQPHLHHHHHHPHHAPRNDLLDYVRALQPADAAALTAAASPAAAAAMDAFVDRLLGVGGAGADRDALRRVGAETTAAEMRQLLFWLMVVGWQLRLLDSSAASSSDVAAWG